MQFPSVNPYVCVVFNQMGRKLVYKALVLVGVGTRLLPHPPNFTSIVAIALFGGVYFSKRIAIILPLAAMLIGDIFLGFYEVKLMASVYISFLLCVFIGFWLKKHKKWHTVLGSSLLSSFLFFFLTNFAVWAFTPWYEKSLAGINECYLMSLPFFKHSLMGDLLYVVVFFGTYELIKLWVEKRFRVPAGDSVFVG